MQPFGRQAAAVINRHLAARGFAQIELVTQWGAIVGGGLAEHCFPSRLSAGAMLTLTADDRAALELQHQAPKVIDRINAYFGRTIVNKIKVVAGEIPRQDRLRPATSSSGVPGDGVLQGALDRVQDGALRQALARLGRHALAESRKRPALKR
jgi:hypothetical protein